MKLFELLRNSLKRDKVRSSKRLTLIARTIVLLIAEIVINAILWIITAITFLRGAGDGHRILGLALIAWTTGLRHALDADHISAIDNATRRIVSVPQTLLIKGSKEGEERTTVTCIRKPVTVGLFFSLGHSTVVIAATLAIAISAGVANKFDGFGNIGGIIGSAVSGSFLILIGCINTVILYKTIKRIKKAEKEKRLEKEDSERSQEKEDNVVINPPAHFNGIMTRIAMPILRSVDRPWKMYPVGVLFGLGFDTASSIALLSVALIAQQQQRNNGSESDASVILFAFLFTAGMTLIDSVDSCLMIWAYAPDAQKGKGWRSKLRLWQNLLDDSQEQETHDEESNVVVPELSLKKEEIEEEKLDANQTDAKKETDNVEKIIEGQRLKDGLDRISFEASASKISLLLTALSIIVAFAIGVVVLMGLIGDQCKRCSNAADKQEVTNNGGLEGRWWLAWRRANDNFTYIGAGIVGAFLVCVVLWYSIRWIMRRQKKNDER